MPISRPKPNAIELLNYKDTEFKDCIPLADSQLVNGNGNAIEIDPITRALTTITYAHHELHEGDMYLAFHRVDLSNGQVFDFSVITPNTTKWPHMVIEADAEFEAMMQIWEAPTLSNNGTPKAAYNKNRNVVNPATTIVNHTPTVTATGSTLIFEDQWGAGKKEGGGARALEEWIFKQDTKYLVRFTNMVTTANYLVVHFNWYEHINKA